MRADFPLQATPRCVTALLRIAAVGLLLGAGCSYDLVRHGSGPGAARTIAVVTLKNGSSQPGVEMMVTAAIRREFLRRGVPRLVSDPARADLVVRGVVLPIETLPRSFSSVVLALEYEVRLKLDLVVQRKDGAELPLDFGSFTESEIYLASSDVEVGRKNRDEALRRISGILAGRLLDALALAEPGGQG